MIWDEHAIVGEYRAESDKDTGPGWTILRGRTAVGAGVEDG